MDRVINGWNTYLKDFKLTNEQQAKVYGLIKEHHEAFSLCDEIGTCPQVKVHLKLCDKEHSFFTHMQ